MVKFPKLNKPCEFGHNFFTKQYFKPSLKFEKQNLSYIIQ